MREPPKEAKDAKGKEAKPEQAPKEAPKPPPPSSSPGQKPYEQWSFGLFGGTGRG